MHIVAVASSFAAAINILFASSVEKICDRGVHSINFFPIKKSAIDIFQCIFGIFLITVLDIHVTDYMISQIIHHNHILNFSKLTHLFKHFLKEFLESNYGIGTW